MLPGVQVSFASFNRTVDQRGAAPSGAQTFAFLLDPDATIHWCGRDADGSNLLIFRPDGEFESLTGADFSVLTISVADELLADAAARLELRDSVWRGRGAEMCRPGPARLAALRRQVSGHLAAPEQDVPVAVMRTLVDDSGSSPAVGPRGAAFKRARSLLAAWHADAPSVRRLAEEAGVSERTLQYAFRDHAGMTPKAYIMAERLNRVRRELQRAGNRQRIGDIALRWGFWHMGQFAADYRAQFGELPSETVRRRRGRAWSSGC